MTGACDHDRIVSETDRLQDAFLRLLEAAERLNEIHGHDERVNRATNSARNETYAAAQKLQCALSHLDAALKLERDALVRA